MKRDRRRPRWGWLYAIFGLMLMLFYIESKMGLSGSVRILAQLGVLVAVYFCVNCWIGPNMPFDPWS